MVADAARGRWARARRVDPPPFDGVVDVDVDVVVEVDVEVDVEVGEPVARIMEQRCRDGHRCRWSARGRKAPHRGSVNGSHCAFRL
jgi:hypothetical protein